MEFSFFRLSLEKILRENYPSKASDIEFIVNRCNEAEKAYTSQVKSGVSPIIAIEIANNTLFEDAYFFKYNLLRDVLLEEFSNTIKEKEHPFYLGRLLPYCEDVFEQYSLVGNDSSTYSLLYTELVGAVTIYLEDHHVI